MRASAAARSRASMTTGRDWLWLPPPPMASLMASPGSGSRSPSVRLVSRSKTSRALAGTVGLPEEPTAASTPNSSTSPIPPTRMRASRLAKKLLKKSFMTAPKNTP